MAQILQLYQLQSLDSEIDQIRQQLKEIDAQLGESKALQQAKTGHETAEATLRQAQTKMKDLALELKTVSNKISNQEKLLYSGKVLSPKEAANLQDEVAALKRWHGDREEHLLEAMVEAEEAETVRDTTATHLADVEADWQAGQGDLLDNQTDLKNKLIDRKKRRPAIAAAIDKQTLTLYERLRTQKAGRAVAAVKGGVCQGCGVTPSSNKLRQARAGTELMTCGACGRILYVP